MSKKQNSRQVKPQNPHDLFVQKMMQDKQVAQHVLKQILPEKLLSKIMLKSIQAQPTQYYSYTGQRFIADLVFSVKLTNNKEARLAVLVEHQSTSDILMPLRISEYVIQEMAKQVRRQAENGKVLPLVIPIVIYHNRRPYRHATRLSDLIDAPKELIDEYFLTDFQLIDLTQIDNEQLKGDVYYGALALSLKHTLAPQMVNLLEVLEVLSEFYKLKDSDLAMFSLEYVVSNSAAEADAALVKAIEQQFPGEFGSKAMTLAQSLKNMGREEGMQKGVQKGREEGMQKGLKQGIAKERRDIALKLWQKHKDIAYVTEITGLSENKLKQIIKAQESANA